MPEGSVTSEGTAVVHPDLCLYVTAINIWGGVTLESRGTFCSYKNVIVSWPEFVMSGSKICFLNQSLLGSLKE